MNQTIQLVNSDTGAVLNILLKRDKMLIMGTWYKLANPTEAMRLLMHCENTVRRSENYHDFGETGVYLYPLED